MSSDPDAADALDRLARGLAPQVTGLGGSTVRELIESRLFASSATVMLGRFELHRVLGAGGMGVVYLARDPELDRKVAIKLLHAELEHPTYDAIRDEAAGLARVSHPNVVTVHEIGTDRGRLFFVMEHVAGSSIDEFCAALGQRRGGRGRALERAIVDVFVQAARGLAAIHRAGLVHRDFKPANVLVGDDGRPRVTDFGLARVLAAAPSTVSSERGDSLHTLGAGTVAYMSPEQIRGEHVDVRADVFGFSA